MCLHFLETFRLYGNLNSFEIPVNRLSSSRNSSDYKLTSAVAVPHICLNFVPETITQEVHREASKLLNKKGRIAAGPDGSIIYYCHNKKNIRMPVPLEYDTRVNGQVVTCLSKSCLRYKSFNVCCHTFAIANKLNTLSTLISKLNAKSTTEQALMNSANVNRDRNCGKKKTNATQKRKGASSNKPQKIAKQLLFPDRGELELSQLSSTSRRRANKPVAATKPVSAKPDLQQSYHFPNTFLRLPPSQNPVIDFSTPARDLKDSFQGVTVPQPMPKIVVQTSQQRYLPNQNLTSYPTFPNPPPNSYVIAILKYCHKMFQFVTAVQDASERMVIPYPHMILLWSQKHRHYTDPKTHQKAMSTDFSNLYYHFH